MARKPKTHKQADSAAVLDDPKALETAMRNGQIPAPEPGNETDPNPKHRRSRAKPMDLPNMRGPGVAVPQHDDLDEMGDELDDLRTKKSKLAEKITLVEKKALDRMIDLGLQRYRFSDRVMEISEGKDHVKVKAVRTGDDDENEE